MAKNGGHNVRGFRGFPGWPSKVHGAPSGGGRFNAKQAGPFPVPSLQSLFLQDVPGKNEIIDGRWLVPPGFISCRGSKVAKTLCLTFRHYGPMRNARSFQLFAECIGEPHHRRWLTGGDPSSFPFQLLYLIASSEMPGEAYDRLIHHADGMPYMMERVVPDWSDELFSIPGAPGSMEPDPAIMDENILKDGVPILASCSIPTTGSKSLKAMIFDHGRYGDDLYVVDSTGQVFGYNGYDLPFALVQLMARSKAPGAFYDRYVEGKYPVNYGMYLMPDRLSKYLPPEA